ncbi:MAG: LexA family transcriptional regulator [Legionellaceae bacterium]|nr:LexA family transcriptional regulator [Legionellaceae bacterium]
MTSSDNIGVRDLAQFEDMAFGPRIAYVIETRGISKAWVAERLGISKQALNYLLKHSIKPKFVDEFAELLGLDPQWIEHGVGALSLKETRPVKRTTLPVQTAAMLLGREDMHSGKSDIEFSHHPGETYTAYKLEDDSNFPPFIEGTVLVFNTNKQPNTQDYVLIQIEKNIFVRQYLVDGQDICFKASNPQHKTFINPGVTILGVLVEARYQLS